MTMPTTPRQVLRFDCDWRFHAGDIDAPLPNKHIAAYIANKAGYARGAAKPSYDDSDWRVLDLPHDWSVEGPFDPANHVSQGYLPRGVAWYRRHFQLEEADRGKSLAIQFDGVATHCTVYINGHLLHRNFCGYTPFTIDISDVANFGDELNVIAVRVDATHLEGWWYEGAGIYRHVWLMKASPVHIAPNGVFVCPKRTSTTEWTTDIEVTLVNNSNVDVHGQLLHTLFRYAGRGVGEGSAGERGNFISEAEPSPLPSPGVPGEGVRVPARTRVVVRQSIPIRHPNLWSTEKPNLYRLGTQLRIDDVVVDELDTTFAYRTIRFDPDHGFFLNDEPLKLLGTCNHQDHAGVGVAVPDSIHEFRIRRLKEMGCNAYRCAHNPPAPELLDACDRLGMLVIDENRNFGSSPEHLAQLEAMVRRDRNHASVILWSICNEEAIQGTPVAAKIARAMMRHVQSLDPSRPVTAAVSGGLLNDDCLADAVEVTGINYQLHVHDQYHAKHPNTPIYAAETHCSLATRGTYHTDPAAHVFASYDEEHASWGATARTTWQEIAKLPFVAGLFAWTGFDYRGEPTPHEWPSVSTHWGILDTCGFEKDAFYLHKAFFTKEPFLHLLPHWNWTPGATVRVMAYTNCDDAELFLNDESLGRKKVDPIEMARWDVAYRPGKLRAVGLRNDRIIAEQSVETTGPAVALGLEIHPSFAPQCADGISADGEFAVPITVFALDEADRRISAASDHVNFTISGPAKLIGVGNGDPTCHEPDKGSSRSLFHGLAQAIIQTTTAAGEVTITATAPNRQAARLVLKTVGVQPRPSVPAARVRHFIRDWRMSPVTPHPPDKGQPLMEQDVNSWDRVEPGQPQPAWSRSSAAGGFAVYRATFTPPRIMQTRGGKIVFQRIDGTAEIEFNGAHVAGKTDPTPGMITIDLPPSSSASTLAVTVHATTAPAGLTGRVELVPSGQ
jgi:beta-galactosidase